jgi:hypothetical protein
MKVPTRYDIWSAVFGENVPRDDSAEEDLFKMLIRDLSTGGFIRQAREADYRGRWKKNRAVPRRTSTGTLESAFEDTKPYTLTQLGSQFVHYTMTELVQRIGDEGGRLLQPLQIQRQDLRLDKTCGCDNGRPPFSAVLQMCSSVFRRPGLSGKWLRPTTDLSSLGISAAERGF